MHPPNYSSSNHPADYIDRAQAMLRFLSATLGDNSPHCHLAEREMEGMCYILEHIEGNLGMANKLLS